MTGEVVSYHSRRVRSFGHHVRGEIIDRISIYMVT